MQAFIDKLFCSQKRVSWRRLAVLILGTGLLATGLLDSEQWLYLSLAYIAGDSAEKAMSAISKKQQMAFVTTKFDDATSFKVAYHSQITNAVTSNLTGGAGSLYSIKIENSNDAAVYIKIANAFTATSGSTAPDWIFSCPAASTYTYEIPNGVAFKALSVWANENAVETDNTTPSVSGNETVQVTIVTGS